MEILKSLIIGWSVVWSATMFVVTKFDVGRGIPLVALPFIEDGNKLESAARSLYWLTPIYTFVVWAIGCILIISINWFITRRRK